MLNNLLIDASETRPFGKHWDVSVHLPINFDALYHFFPVGFQPAVEIVQVMDTRHAPRNGVKKFGRHRFAQRVMTLLLPSRYQIKLPLCDPAVQFREERKSKRLNSSTE